MSETPDGSKEQPNVPGAADAAPADDASEALSFEELAAAAAAAEADVETAALAAAAVGRGPTLDPVKSMDLGSPAASPPAPGVAAAETQAAVAAATVAAATAAAAIPPAAPASAQSAPLVDLDAVFAAEDPEFAGAMSAIQADAELRADHAEVAPLDDDAVAILAEPKTRLGRAMRFLARPFVAARRAFVWALGRARDGAIWFGRVGAKQSLLAAFAGLKAAAGFAGAQLKRFMGLPLQAKLMCLTLVGLVVLAALLANAMLKGKRLPGYESPFLASMADVADAHFEFGDDEPMEEFNSPLRATEHVVLLGKTIVNLRREAGSGPTPMGLFEFYVEANSQDAAVELVDRKSEAADVAHRTVESMSFEELATTQGKLKLKLLLRRDLNGMLTKGRVRRVYYKSVVLKP